MKPSRVISFSSGKGGVGKTAIVANLGYSWARAGKNTLLVDGDWSLGKLSIAVGARPQWTIESVLQGERKMSEAIHGLSPNLSLLASPSGVVGFEELTEAHRIQLFYEIDALRHTYDLIILDHSSGVHWGVLQFAAASHQHIIVTTTEPTSYTDAYAIMKILSKRFAIREFWLLVTMCRNQRETEKTISRFLTVARNHLDVRISLLDVLPWEGKLCDSIRLQKPLVEAFPETELALKFHALGRKIETTQCQVQYGLRYFYDNSLGMSNAKLTT